MFEGCDDSALNHSPSVIKTKLLETFTSPKAPRPMTLRDSKSSKPSLVLFNRRNSVSFRACCERRVTFCRRDSESERCQRAFWVTA